MIFSVYIAIFFLINIIIPVTFCNDLPMPNSSMTLPPPLQNDFPTKCFKDLGCFETGPPYYHPIIRPISLLPFDEEHIDTKFLLFTRRNPAKAELLDHNCNTIKNSSFNPYCPTKIIIHGFTIKLEENKEYTMMKNAILKRGYHNVILVNWTDSNQAPYFQAVANGRVVGAQIARLISALQYFTGANPENFHLIGHSLGAAVAGWAGERIQYVGRITGLDPAGILFYNAPPAVRLDTSDALFVDVIITNGGMKYEDGIGSIEPIGHVNFYPNGGNIQPGCYNASGDNLKEFDFQRNVCSHMRSVFLFMSTIVNDQCRFMATECNDYESFLSRKCYDDRFWWRTAFGYSHHSKKIEMGFNTRLTYYDHPPIGQKYFLTTGAEPPFCIQHHIYKPSIYSLMY